MVIDSDEEEAIDSEGEEEEADTETGTYKKNYVTTRYMTKYERARILGTRALQIRCAAHQCHNRRRHFRTYL